MSHFTNESSDLFAFEDQPPPLDKDFAAFQQKEKAHEVVGDFEKFDDVKASPVKKDSADLLGDFLDHERQAPPPPSVPDVRPRDAPPAVPTFEAFEAVPSEAESKPVPADEDFGQIQPDYLNPYATASKLETNEKFISTDDLIGLSDNEGGKADKEHAAFEDCNKDEDDEDDEPMVEVLEEEEEIAHQPAVQAAKEVEPVFERKPEPLPEPEIVKETPKPAPAPKVEPPKELPVQKKPVERIEAEKIFMNCGLDAWFKPEALHPKVESLIYWRDVKKSGVVFGIGLSVLLALSCCSLISVFAYVSLFALAGTVAFRIYKNILQAIQKTSEGHPFKEYLETDLTLSQERVQQVSTVAVSHVNAAVTELRRLFLVEDLVDSIKFGVLLYCLTYVGALFNGMTLIILSFVALFSLPKVYETNKTVIDAQLDMVRSKITEITDKVKAAVPIGKKTDSDKDK
ncbi:reticulon-1-like [Culicoides brevitarsis]|uniref:reticulon-1-like n=1 Tax=Culicoides brevitarsis TaxID=469753 RepID=UPI00307C011E